MPALRLREPEIKPSPVLLPTKAGCVSLDPRCAERGVAAELRPFTVHLVASCRADLKTDEERLRGLPLTAMILSVCRKTSQPTLQSGLLCALMGVLVTLRKCNWLLTTLIWKKGTKQCGGLVDSNHCVWAAVRFEEQFEPTLILHVV